MILRPVRPVSPMGPPVTKRPVGLMWYVASLAVEQVAGDGGQDDLLDDVLADAARR